MDEPQIKTHIDRCRQTLQEAYIADYMPASRDTGSQPAIRQPITKTPAVIDGSPVKSFTARFKRAVMHNATDELDDYFKLPLEDFKTCDPLHWWSARKAQFPNLSQLARDIFSIPGSAVGVERVFSSGRDTIALRRARLKPETIRTLMVLKQRLHLTRVAIDSVVHR